MIVAIREYTRRQSAEGYSCGVVGKKKMLVPVWRDHSLDSLKRDRGVEDEEIGEFESRTGERGDIGKHVEDVPEDGERFGLLADKRRSTGEDAVMSLWGEELEAAGVGTKSQGIIVVVVTAVPGLETVTPCHMDRDSSHPQIAFEVGGPNGMSLLDGNQGWVVMAFC